MDESFENFFKSLIENSGIKFSNQLSIDEASVRT